jgi:hypothetical protein
MPYKVAEKPGDPTGIIEIGRLSAPLPTILPSYNQIGFDSIHYILGIVEGNDDKAVVWGVGGKLTGEQTTVVDPELNIRFVLEMEYDNGLVNLLTEEGFTLEFNGWDMPYDLFRVSTKVDPQTGQSINKTSINAIVKADEIAFYGPFMKILGVSDFNTGLIYVSAACDYMPYNNGVQYAPDGIGEVKFISDDESVTAEITNTILKADEHNFGILLIDEASGKPISLNYSKVTSITASDDGLISKVTVEFSKDRIKNNVKAYFMVDAYPSYTESIKR